MDDIEVMDASTSSDPQPETSIMAPVCFVGTSAVEQRLEQLEQIYLKGASCGTALSLETLLDSLVCLYDECCNSTLRKEKSIAEFVEFAKPIVTRVKALRLSRDDFDVLKVIGRGSFGEVAVVRMVNTDKVYAMKILNKWEMLKRAETACFKEERDVMVHGNRQWITNLHYAFQDERNLYFIMDYYVGGDLLTLIVKFEEHLPETMVKFYVAEMILAIDAVHRLGYVHRDIKPENVLIDISGHVKLGDFGSCLKRRADGTVFATTPVGTPDYISPECLQSMENGRGVIGAVSDWWSLGACMYEMIFGETPFYAESLIETYSKIMNHEEMFEFPDGSESIISEEARDLISQLICAPERRLGLNGLDDFRQHPFFADTDWEHMREMEAPYKPEVSSPTDTSNFDIISSDFTPCNTQPPNVTAPFTGHHLPFIGFTYTHGSIFSDSRNVGDLLKATPATNQAQNVQLYGESELATICERLEDEKTELQNKLNDITAMLANNRSSEENGADNHTQLPPKLQHQLRDEIQILRKRLEENESNSVQNRMPIKEPNVEELERKFKESKEKNRQLILDKQELQKELEDVTERLTTQSKDWKAALRQRDTALQDFEEINSTLIEERSNFAKSESSLKEQESLARQLQEKCEIFKSELRTALTTKADLESKLAAIEKELDSEKVAKALLEAKLSNTQSHTTEEQKDGKIGEESDTNEQVERLNEELGKLRNRFSEQLQLEERRRMESTEQWEKQVDELQALLEEQQIAMQKLKGDYEEDKILWNKQHQEHIVSVEKLYTNRIKSLEGEVFDLKQENDVLRAENSRLENELNSQPTSTLTAQQMHELIQLISDEKEARESLQDLASRLTGDLESLKQSQTVNNGSPGGANVYANQSTPQSAPMENKTQTWGSRRMNKQVKYGRFEAQQYLEAEIRAKQQALEELRTSRARCDETEKELFEARRKIKQQKEELDRALHENSFLRQQQQQVAMRHHPQQRQMPMDMPDILDFSQHSQQSAQHQRIMSNNNTGSSNFFNSFASPASTSEFSAFSTRSSRGMPSHSIEGMDYESPSTYTRNQHQPQLYENQNPPHHRYPGYSSTPHGHLYGHGSTHGGRGASPKVLQSLNNALNGKGHRFIHASLKTPTKCISCTSILIGFDRQGMFCQDCQVSCHVSCVSKVPPDCPVPMEKRRPDGIDPVKGTGTAYEGVVKTPKPAGLKRGWQTTYVIVCDFKLYLYDCTVDKHGKPIAIEPYIRQVLDMKDPDFRVSSATENDAIHASKSDLPKIFKITFSQIHDAISCNSASSSACNTDTMGSTGSGSKNNNHNDSGVSNQSGDCALVAKQYALLMADSAEEVRKWVVALTELRNLFIRCALPDKSVYTVRELCDISALPILKTAQCAAIIDRNKFVLGFSDHGLMCVELERETITPVGGEKENSKRNVEQVEYDEQEQLLIAMIGTAKDRHVRLIPTAAMDGRDLKWIKVNETKNCHLMCWGTGHQPRQAPVGASIGQHYFAVAVHKTVIVYQIDRSEKRHRKVREMAMPGQPQTLKICNGKLFVGYPSSFRMWDLIDNSQTSLVNLEDGSLQFLNQTLHDAEMIISVNGDEDTREFLLVFQKLGIYVDSQGRRCRAQELMFPSKPTGFSYSRPNLCLYTEYQIIVFNVLTAEWIQTVNLKRAKPLHVEGVLSLCYVADAPHLVMLGSQAQSADERLYIPQTSQLLSAKGIPKRRRKFSIKTSKDEAGRGDRRSQLPISGPSDFIHITHMGPGHVVELQSLMEIKSSNPVASTSNSSISVPGGYPQSHTSSAPSAAERVKQFINPIMRSSSSSGHAPTHHHHSQHMSSVQSLRDSNGRPLSSHSRNSEGSSLGKDGKLPNHQNASISSDSQLDNYYLEPISKSNHPASPSLHHQAGIPTLPSTNPPQTIIPSPPNSPLPSNTN
ncbi:protein kinase domain-containing protein [Ditylenchus destructor]|uniref:non-specific serine/threonine protein kinase n=1 Tax=Ditylenchus destructor TaxID=166010 RepID=A0AAD4R4A4_9BILA|nr:protein kinase domain-containing protein [Ditylenchus destructor]